MKKDLASQYRGLREGCGLWSNSTRALLVVTGEDRERLLNGLVTCEVKGLAPGRGVRGFFTDVKGHILADVVIRGAEDRLWLELPAPLIPSIVAHIEKYIVVDRVEVLPAADREALSLVGPGAATVLAPLPGDASDPEIPWSHFEITLRGQTALVFIDGHFGVPALTLWSSPSAIAAIRQDLLTTAALQEVDDEATEVLRVEEGAPRFGIDFGLENLPQETGLDDAVSYTKGCYLGQEVVARLHYRGQVARQLCRLRSAHGDSPIIGSRLLLDDREAGTVTSAVQSPLDDGVSVLAMLQRRATEVGTQLQLDGGRVLRVV